MQSRPLPHPDHGERPYYPRRGHTPQISISDDTHHVTEAIGGMYGSDDEDYMAKRNSRPLSFIRSPAETFDVVNPSFPDSKRASPPRTPLARTVSNERVAPPNSDSSAMMAGRKGSLGTENSPISPGLSRKSSSSETAIQQFPLNDIDYESSPAAVAQELSNLQAIRRMSMNVDTADPDLPTFATGISPSPSDDEDDASRLFWVPARLHPELAPKEFKTFVEDRVDRIRQRSGSPDSLSPTSLERSDSGSLRRRKSMLSRQINNSKGYEDGAERLERKRSEGRQHRPSHQHSDVETLAELETLVSDPENMIRKISLESTRQSLDSGVEVPASEDMPILPPVGMSLKRSTRTTYRRGSVRKGDFSKRTLGRRPDQDASDGATTSPAPAQLEEPFAPIARVQTEPTPPPSETPVGAPQPRHPGRLALGASASSENLIEHARNAKTTSSETPTSSEPARTQSFHSRIASNGRTTAQIPGVPHIVETPPPNERLTKPNTFTLPERRSSHAPPPSVQPNHTPPRSSSAARGAHTRPALVSSRTQHTSSSTLDDISSNPSPLPGSGGTRTDALTMVPTFEEKKADKKKGGDRKTSWNWLLGGEEKEKEKQREKEEREREEKAAKKSKSSTTRAKPTDKTRLDVLQSSIDGSGNSRGRESLVLDRESIQLDEERKKQSTRKSSESSSKKEKDSGILSAIFGGGKRAKAASEETTHKKRHSSRALSPEPPPRILRPDIDYNWTRFSILEERAIYRMAHIKLANPKRALHSQVLLSNFMYSYLAKVQMMHPQMQIPAAQKAAQAKSQNPPKTQERQAEEYSQYQRWQEQQEQQQQEQQQQQQQQQQSQHLPDSRAGAEHDTEAMDDRDSSRYHDQHHRGQGSQSGHDYLGYAKHEQPFEQQSLWDDGDSKEEDLW